MRLRRPARNTISRRWGLALISGGVAGSSICTVEVASLASIRVWASCCNRNQQQGRLHEYILFEVCVLLGHARNLLQRQEEVFVQP